MAIKKVLKIEGDTSNVDQALKGTQEQVDKLDKSIEDVGKGSKGTLGNYVDDLGDVQKQSNKTEKQTKKTGKSFISLKGIAKTTATGIKAIGTAMKAAGIGLIIAGFAALANILSKNQKVMDGVTTVANALQLGFNAVVEAFTNTWERAKELTGGFDAMKKVIGGVLTLAVTPLKLGFYELKLAMQGINLAYQKLFGDDESVKEAKKSITETTSTLLQLGKDAVQAGVDIKDNFTEAISESVVGVSTLTSEIGKIDPKKILDTAKAMTDLKNNSEVAAAVQAGLVEEYDRQAEKLRQIRDDDRISIEERIKNNEKLAEVLKNQEQAMLKQADAQIASAKAQYQANGNQENYIALLEAENNKKAVLAQIEGFISEQKSNAVALDKERLDLINATLEATEQETINRQKAIAENISDEGMRLEALRAIYEQEKQLELDRLANKRDSYAEGTQAFIDAQKELQDKQVEYREQDIQWEADIRTQKAEQLQLDLENETLAFDEKRLLVEERRQVLLEDESLSDQERTVLLRENSQQRRAIDDAELQYKAQVQGQVADLIGQFGGFLKQIAGDNKELAIAGIIAEQVAGVSKIISNTGVANAKAVAATPLTGGQPFVTLNTVSAGLSIAGSIAGASRAIKDIKSNKSTPSAGGISSGGGGGIAAPRVAGPSFNIVGEAGPSQIGAAVGNEINNQPIKTYVVASEVTTQQALERQVEGQATIS